MRLARQYFQIHLLFLVGLVLWPATGYINYFRPHLSYWLKHVPLCMAENAGFLPPRRAHYSEGRNATINVLYCTPAKPPRLVGGPLNYDLIIVSDMGGVVQRINTTGRLVWQRRLSAPRGLDIQGNRILVGQGQKLRELSLATGADLKAFEFDQPIRMFHLDGTDLFVLMDIDGNGGVRRYDLSNGTPLLVSSSSIKTQYPRGIDVDAASVYVADTFGHRVIRFGRESLELQDEAPSYFPNSVQIVGHRLLVAEEHLNVISEFLSRPLVRRGPVISSSAHPPRIVFPGNHQTMPCNKSISSVKLYSPNDAIDVDGRVYVADTDNHRVLELSSGRVVAQLTAFNNPVNIRAVGR